MNDYRVTFEVVAPGARQRESAVTFPQAVTRFAATYQAADEVMDSGWTIIRHVSTEMRTQSGAWFTPIDTRHGSDVPAPS
jgi:hypothetical protein